MMECMQEDGIVNVRQSYNDAMKGLNRPIIPVSIKENKECIIDRAECGVCVLLGRDSAVKSIM